MFPISAGVVPEGAIDIQMFEEEHALELFQLIERNRTSLRQWLPWLDCTNVLADTVDHIRVSKKRFEESNGFSAGIRINGTLCGAIGLHAIDPRHRSSSIGYWLTEGLQGRGVMTKACRAVVGAAFEHYGLHRIEIRCATGNNKSCAIPERLGFQYEGTLREAEWLYDHFVDLRVYSMLEQDWPRPL
ncbi:MAG TPA: GNAT family protein [Bryobacteraceae bacterium]|jgi:ribosomal-protein-serine acetyltransferase